MTHSPAAASASVLKAAHSRVLVVTFIVAVALGSALLFLVEPLVVRMMLPLIGGSPAVWITAMVFFQSALLAGYLLAHLARRWLTWSSRPWLQIGFVAFGLVVLPVALPHRWVPPSGGQALWILAALTVMLGVPFVALSMLGPTLQGWFADTSHPRRQEPYFLYAAGNVGSIVGLLGYPLLVEPFVGLETQSRLWAVGYGILLVLLIASAALRKRYPAPQDSHTADVEPLSGPPTDEHDGASIPWRMRAAWVVMAAIPSGLLLAVTQHISADVAAVPLLWVVPLTIYLATFVIAFSKPTDGCPQNLGRGALLMILPLLVTFVVIPMSSTSLVAAVVINLSAFGLLALAIHFELSASRPPAARLTEYYLWIAVGGLVGGIAVALIAPVVFDSIAEYPLFLIAALAVLWWAQFAHGSSVRRFAAYVWGGATVLVVLLLWLGFDGPSVLLVAALAVGGITTYVISRSQPRIFITTMVGVLTVLMLMPFSESLHQSRSFFGVLRVSESSGDHVLEHGSTIHGWQRFDPDVSVEPTAYYRRDSGIGRIMQVLTVEGPQRRFAVVGLGAGTLATYGRSTDHFEFFEIDQSVLDVAANPQYFTFLNQTPASVTTSVVDGRIGLADSDGNYDLIVLDAFSSDAVPIHLLTQEAAAIYADRLSPTGVIAVHISNRYFDLGPIVARVAEQVGMVAKSYKTPKSHWVVLSKPANVQPEITTELTNWTAIPISTDTPLWTDDYANLLAAFRGF